jgi:multidrug efflux pump subunit AcrA (membrane-fusion protein)
MMKRALTACALVVYMAFSGCSGTPADPDASHNHPEVKATVAAVEKVSVNTPYEAVGTVRSRTSSTMQSKATGNILAVHVNTGDFVESGQTLVEIDDREAAAQVRSAESALRQAQESLQEAEKSVQAAMHARAAAEADNVLAASTYERVKGLADKQAVSRQVFDEASAKYKSVAAQAAQAGEIVASIQARRGEAQARIEQAQAQLENAKAFLSHTKVEAPFAGLVTKKWVEVGDMASPGAPLLEMEDVRQYRLEAVVDEVLVQRIKQGDKVPVVLDAIGSGSLDGVVAELVPSADPSSRTFLVKIDLPPTQGIKSGMFGRASFSAGQADSLVLPVTAVFERGQLSGVYVVGEGGMANLRLITVGKRRGDMIEVLSGLDPGERVVVDGIDRVTDGCVVR